MLVSKLVFSILSRFPHFLVLFFDNGIVELIEGEFTKDNEVKSVLIQIFHLYVLLDNSLLLSYYRVLGMIDGTVEPKLVDTTLSILNSKLLDETSDKHTLLQSLIPIIPRCSNLCKVSALITQLLIEIKDNDGECNLLLTRLCSLILTQTLLLEDNQTGVQIETLQNLLFLFPKLDRPYQFVKSLNPQTMFTLLGNDKLEIAMAAYKILNKIICNRDGYALHFFHHNYADMFIGEQDKEPMFLINMNIIIHTFSHKQLNLYTKSGSTMKIVDSLQFLAPNSLVLALMALIKLLRFLRNNQTGIAEEWGVINEKVAPYKRYWDLRVRKLALFVCDLY